MPITENAEWRNLNCPQGITPLEAN